MSKPKQRDEANIAVWRELYYRACYESDPAVLTTLIGSLRFLTQKAQERKAYLEWLAEHKDEPLTYAAMRTVDQHHSQHG